jgi:tetratricopeptide (TPR) repeat protein
VALNPRQRQSVRPILIAVATLLAAVLAASPATAFAADIPALPPAAQPLYSAGHYGQAADALQAAIAQNPKDPSLYYWLGRCYYEVRDFKRSIASWERAVELDAGRSDYHDWLGRAYGRKADEESHSNMAGALSLAHKTRHEFEAAVQLDLSNVNAQRDLISFKASAPPSLGGGETQTLEQIHALSAVDPVEGTLALADFYAGRKKFDQADEEYQKVLKSAAAKINAYLEAADYYGDRADAEHFHQAVEAVVKIAPSDRRLSYYRGVSLVLERKDPAAAENNLRTYIATVPDNSEVPAHASAYEWLGKLYEGESKPDLAAAQYQTALTLDPQNKAMREALKRLQKK